VGIGPRTYFEVEKVVRTFSRLNWLAGEIYIISGLDEALAISRDTFTWSPQYEAIQDYFRKILTKYALWVENVAVAEKSINEAISDVSIPTKSTAETISNSVVSLHKAGFEIVHRDYSPGEKQLNPVTIDKNKKRVTVIDEHPILDITKKLPNSGLNISYGSFDRATPVRMLNDTTMEVNKTYPLFKRSKVKSQLLEQVHIILYEAKLSCNNVEDMYLYIVNALSKLR